MWRTRWGQVSGEWDEQQKIGLCMEDSSMQQRPETDKRERERVREREREGEGEGERETDRIIICRTIIILAGYNNIKLLKNNNIFCSRA